MPGVSGDVYAQYTGRLSANMKTVYKTGKIDKVYPADTPFIMTIGGLSKAEGKVGNKFRFPLATGFSQGHTYAAAGAGAFPFRQSRPGKKVAAEVDSTNHFHRISADWETLERAKDGNGNIPDGAFEDNANLILQDLRTGTMQRIEESFLYAGTNLGIFEIDSASVATETIDGVSTSVLKVRVTYETFASYLFTGKEGAPYDFYVMSNGRPTGTVLNNAATVTLGDNTTTNRPLILESFAGLSNRELWFSGNATDLAAIVTQVTTNDATVGLVYWGQRNNDTLGLEYAISNGTTGSIYGLDPTSSVFLRGHVVSNGNNQMTMTRFMRALDPLVQLGLQTSSKSMPMQDGVQKIASVDVWCNPATWRDLMMGEIGLVRHASAGGSVKQGFDEIIITTEVGNTRFISYPRIKKGQLHVVPTAMVCKKVGATEPYLKDWDSGGQKYLRQLEGVAGVEAGMYGNLGLYIDRLAWCLTINNIRNSDYA
jgi:hypothetical protein